MSSDVLAQVVSRMSKDAAFRQAVAEDPSKALAAYELTDEEKRNLLSSGGTADLGLDQRITKAKKFR